MKANTETYETLREDRLTRGITQVQLSHMSGVPQATITRLERLPKYRAYKKSIGRLKQALKTFDELPDDSVDAVIQRARMTNISTLRERLLKIKSDLPQTYHTIIYRLWPST